MKIQPIRRFSPAFHAALEAVRNAAPVNRTANDNMKPHGYPVGYEVGN